MKVIETGLSRTGTMSARIVLGRPCRNWEDGCKPVGRKTMKPKGGTLALASMLALGVPAASAQTFADDPRPAEDRWEALWQAKDAEALAALYATDAMRLPPHGSRTVGPEAIEAVFEEEFAAGLENLQLEATEIGHDGNLGRAVGDQSVEFPVEGEMMTGTGTSVVHHRKEEDGVWRIVIGTWNDAP
ncbi:YybH family protein [Jannaschia formosa]|uniref:YybH family protein n=1 Tax=Jannaschia formosa TaxID=2259592 RepID=UPI0014317642|nr:SgcJ/EcaC family oxidoreductase [Jannaschia formosa]